jgi:hypothetical protein
VGNIAPDALFRKPVVLPKVLRDLVKSHFQPACRDGFQLTLRYICMSKNDTADSDAHRQIWEEVYTH